MPRAKEDQSQEEEPNKENLKYTYANILTNPLCLFYRTEFGYALGNPSAFLARVCDHRGAFERYSINNGNSLYNQGLSGL